MSNPDEIQKRRAELRLGLQIKSQAAGTWGETPAAYRALEIDAETRLHAELSLKGILCRCAGDHVPEGLAT